MALIPDTEQDLIEKIPNLSKTDEAIASLIYSIDCINAGKLLKARLAIRDALLRLDKQNPSAIDDRVLDLIKGVREHG